MKSRNDNFKVTGGARLQGQVRVTGAKNSVLKLMGAALLAEGTTVLTNCPEIADVPYMADVLRGLGCRVVLDGPTVYITVPEHVTSDADFDAVRKFRASVCVLGPLTARSHRAVVALPGGDAIGSRPLDMHQSGLEKLGATTKIEHGCVVSEAESLHGASIKLDFPSVGATENILTAAVLAEGTTILDNAAREPEIVDLCTMLSEMGAKISGAGSNTITVEGVPRLDPVRHEVIGDRIVAGTWAYAAAITQGDITVGGIDPSFLHLVLEKVKGAGAEVETYATGFRVVQNHRPKAVDYQTLPFPGFPTDLQPMAIALCSVSEGTSVITENVFESRFRFVDEMTRLGADAYIDGHHVMIRGVEQLSSAPVWSSDIRAGAGLVLAGLCADGMTEVNDVYHIDRGYPDFVETLTELGATIERAHHDSAE
ncbi:UDP-N-acetylglucosamine 1-carboxyvinyltransferase [Corynebacterium pseudokroppenstedtii]|uniref:UDP-N-acetylglucosamine 1-carboxyvinyltransferase n=1 Tax=Corynebacterium pseudokroppenstedtii TaxID=2804917 RepID=A0AAU0Q2E8_9CORY|nr:UDP-N-acetylglucosamine 1-carboxyvinyltransferase [Corynebacterium pseudokroppenstedtii]QRP15441.1 UDP-N-acetylglucosamine 1-carboxyvinyltransferase [Corynebacterium kroppenstedtii]MBY0791583.1 UDP-N-acetylglucosamine 1-carboxyvinyltransferase [Corynebacterium pseudokroppenstedtii]MCF6794398.1 UDP-N-acetylglucosamine 1-carboxyvinyltransferase [Corynebacterium pseudokroppenstedtii]MCF8704027.1 UDP-N-acetylglucosamine 1-carboxyvinyltransferase [Corynebacterium pseudokroppenstedtii]MCG2637534.